MLFNITHLFRLDRSLLFIFAAVLFLLCFHTAVENEVRAGTVDMRVPEELSEVMEEEDIESAEKIKEHMSGKADLIIYGYYPRGKNGNGGREVSDLLFLQENEGNMEIYSLPLENFLSMEQAQKLGRRVNSGRPSDRLEASLLYAQAQMDTTLNLSEGVMLLLRFMTGIPEDVNFYHPASYEGDSWPSTI